MSEDAGGSAAAPSPIPGKLPWLAASLAWAIPGLGHLYLGWHRRGALYLAVIATMFATGLLLDGTLSRPGSGAFLAKLATLADLGNGIPYVVAQLAGWGAGRAASATHEAGNAFHWSAGILNMLLVADAWDIATGRKTGRASA